MNLSTFHFTLDVKDAVSRIVIPIKQSDTGRKLQISLTDGHKPYEITSECLATLRAVKPDGTVLFNACTAQGNQIETEIRAQMVAAVGMFPCEVTLYGADGRQLISPKFTLNVLEKIGSDEEIESTDEYSALTKTMSEAAGLISNIQNKLENGEFKGEKGDPFKYEDFTADQLKALKGDSFKYEDFTAEQLKALKGDPFTYKDFTQEQLDGLRGKDGNVSFEDLTDKQKQSLKGDPFTYEDFTEEQLKSLRGDPFTYEDFTEEQLEALAKSFGIFPIYRGLDSSSISLNDVKNIAGGKGFSVKSTVSLGGGKGRYYLNTVEGITVEMEICVRLDSVNASLMTVTAVSEQNCYIDVDNYVDIAMDPDPSDSENHIATNYIIVVGHPELGDMVVGFFAVSLGYECIAQDKATAAFGRGNKAVQMYAFVCGRQNIVGYACFSAGYKNICLGNSSFTTGQENYANGSQIFLAGKYNKGTGQALFGAGMENTIEGIAAASFGYRCIARGNYTFSAGWLARALQDRAAAFGYDTVASGYAAFVCGSGSKATNDHTLATGNCTEANGKYSASFGWGTIANAIAQLVCGKFNIPDNENKYAEIVGGGTGFDEHLRANIRTLDWLGNAWFAGDITLGSSKKKVLVEGQAAPSGYGLGVKTSNVITTESELNSAMVNGWYYYSGTWLTVAGISFGHALVHVMGQDKYNVVQEIFPAANNIRLVRYASGGVWGDFACDNPPMGFDMEYRTTEQFKGKAVYVKKISLGTLPASGTKDVVYSTTEATNVVRYEGFCVAQGSNVKNTFPFFTVNGELRAKLDCTPVALRITAFSDSSGNVGEGTVWYTKD